MTHQFSSPRSRQRLNPICALMCMLLALSAVPARADNTEDATKLLGPDKYAEDMQKAHDFLAKNPRDAQMRFRKGVLLTEQKKSDEAIVVFTQLVDDYPNLPEAYNNLAALFAASGQFDRARTALDNAIRLNPSYATAHENLGDVYFTLATQAYDKVLQIDSGNASVKAKRAVARKLVDALDMSKAPDVASKTAPVAQATAPHADSDDALNAINAWAAAWSARDVKKYLMFYSDNYIPPQSQSRKAWTDERRARIAGKSRISVSVESPQVNVDGNIATAKFQQVYVSDRITDRTMKTLVLEKRDGQWRIKLEQAG